MTIRDKFDAINTNLENASIDIIEALEELSEIWEDAHYEGEDGSIALDEISSRIIELSIEGKAAIEKAAEINPADCIGWW